MLTQIELTGPSLAPLPAAQASPIAGGEAGVDPGRAGELFAFIPASLTQKASVAKVSIDPTVDEPRKLLKPFGIEMWSGDPAPETDADRRPGSDADEVAESMTPRTLDLAKSAQDAPMIEVRTPDAPDAPPSEDTERAETA